MDLGSLCLYVKLKNFPGALDQQPLQADPECINPETLRLKAAQTLLTASASGRLEPDNSGVHKGGCSAFCVVVG